MRLSCCIGILLSAMLVCAQPLKIITGVLYSDHGGASGSATGNIQMNSAGRTYTFHYQKPYPVTFSSDACRTAGAIWTITYKADSPDWNLVSAECHEQNSSAEAAISLVKKFLRDLQSKNYRLAYGLIGPPKERSPIRYPEFVQTVEGFDDWKPYNLYGGDGNCLDIVQMTPELVKIHAGLACNLVKSGNPNAGLGFEVRKAGGQWVLAGIKQLGWNQ